MTKEQIKKIPKCKRVMIIDDTAVDRYIAQHVMNKFSFAEEIISMESAQKALDYLSAFSGPPTELPQFIFLDIRMPEIDGFGFLEHYNLLPDLVKKNCIILMLSTTLDSRDLQRIRENKFVKKFVNKPLDKEKLSEICELHA